MSLFPFEDLLDGTKQLATRILDKNNNEITDGEGNLNVKQNGSIVSSHYRGSRYFDEFNTDYVYVPADGSIDIINTIGTGEIIEITNFLIGSPEWGTGINTTNAIALEVEFGESTVGVLADSILEQIKDNGEFEAGKTTLITYDRCERIGIFNTHPTLTNVFGLIDEKTIKGKDIRLTVVNNESSEQRFGVHLHYNVLEE